MSEINPAPYYDDEISISELLMKLWAKRGLIVMLPLIFAGLTVVALLFGKTAIQNELSFYIELNGIVLADTASEVDEGSNKSARPSRSSDPASGTTTSNSSNSTSRSASSSSSSKITARYPNGTVFSPQDLTNPTVIALLAEDTGLNSQELAKAIDVQFGTPLSNGVLVEYKAALSASSNASTENLMVLNERYRRKLDAAAKSGIKIMVDFVALGVPSVEGERIAKLLPKLWNTVYIEQFATQMSPEIATLRWTSDNFDVRSAIGLQEADIQLTNLKRGVELLAADHRLRGVKSSSGSTAADLKGYVDEYRSIFFDPLALYAFNRDETLTRLYVQDLRFEIQEIDLEITELNSRLAEIKDYRGGENAGAGDGGGASTLQMDSGGLSTLVSLAEQAALADYLQDSLNGRFELIQRRATLSTRLDRITADTVSGQVSESFIDTAVMRYETITSTYADILAKAQSVLQANTPSFYTVTTQPSIQSAPLIGKRDLLFVALALALGGMLAIIAALVWPKPEGAS